MQTETLFLTVLLSILTYTNGCLIVGCSFTYGDWCYKAVTTGRTQAAAEEYCQSWQNGAHLALVDSQQESDAIKAGLAGFTNTDIWFNGLVMDGPTSYRWSNGETATFTDFATNEGNNQNEPCTTMERSHTFMWADVTCEREEAFLCKAPCSGSQCIMRCDGLPNGNYQSCKSCSVFATCAEQILYDDRPCPVGLVWDDVNKVCDYESQTCYVGSTPWWTPVFSPPRW